MQDTNYTNHRLYGEFQQLRADDAIFADLYADTEEDFHAWAMPYEQDTDRESWTFYYQSSW